MVATNEVLFATTYDRLWWRALSQPDAPWHMLGQAVEVVAMTAAHGKLFAASDNGRLWRRDAVCHKSVWEDIGSAVDVVALAANNALLFALNSNRQLLCRPYAHDARDWLMIDSAIEHDFVAMACTDRGVFTASYQNDLYRRNAIREAKEAWENFGHANEVGSMTAFGQKLLCIDWNNVLWELEPKVKDLNWSKVSECNELDTGIALAPVALAATRKRV